MDAFQDPMTQSLPRNHAITVDGNVRRQPVEPATPSLGPLSIVLRHWPLILICSLVAGAAGFFLHQRIPPDYMASTDIVIETRRAPVFSEMSAHENWSSTSKIKTAMTIIESSLILEDAAEKNNFQDLPSFKSMAKDAEGPIDLPAILKRTVKVTTPDERSSILRISARASDPEDCRVIADGVAAAYIQYVEEQNEGSSEEIKKLISEAKDDLLEQLGSLENDYAEFRQDAPLIWRDGQAINIHHERQIDLEQKRKELQIEHSLLVSKIRKLSDSIASDESARKAVRFEALKELGQPLHSRGDIRRDVEQGPSSIIEKGLAQEYVAMSLRERNLAREYGPGHPELSNVRSQLNSLRQRLLLVSQGANINADPSSEVDDNLAETYVRVLKDRANAIKDQIARLDLLFKQEEAAATEIQRFLPREQAFKKDIDRTEKLFEAVVARLDEVSIIKDYEGDKVRVIEPAQAGDSRGWTLLRTILTATMAGLGLGFAIAFFFEQFDDSFVSPGEIRGTLGAPILAQVPRFKSKPGGVGTDTSIADTIHTFHHPRSRSSEAIRGMRTALYFNARHQRSQVLQFTSPMPADGKSTLVANLAVAIANSGKTVVIVDADCRRPTAHKIFGLEQGTGLVQLIRGEAELDDAVVDTEVDGLFLIRSGGIPDYPSELISSESFDSLLDVLRESFDFVLVDSPPVLAVTDGAAIAAKVDGVVMVLRLTDKARNLAMRAKQMLEGVDANLLGVVVNALDRKAKTASYRSYSNYGYGNAYGYGYGAYGEEIHEYYEEGRQNAKSGSNGNGHALRIAADETAG